MLSDRQSTKVLIQLGRYAATGPMIVAGRGGMPPDMSDAQRAVIFAEAGWLAMNMAIQTACDPIAGRHRKSRRVWRAMTPESGAGASIFFAHGLAEIARRLSKTPGSTMTSERHAEVRELLSAHLPWSAADENELQRAVAVLDVRTGDGLEEAEAATVLSVLRRIIGDQEARQLPGFVPASPFEPSAYVAGLSWRIAGNEWLRPYLALSDPDAEKQPRGL